VDTSTKKIEDYGNRLANMVEKNDWEGKYIQLSAWHQVASHLIKNQGRSLKTLDHLIKANTKDLSMIWMIVRRGKIHRSMGNDQDALKDFGLAIELLEQNQLVIAQRSATFGLSQNDDKQDDSFDRFLQEISEEIKKKKEMSMAVPNVLLGLNPDSFDRMFLEANKAFLC
jgi:tetratricopeptide (TPR) repeat protein